LDQTDRVGAKSPISINTNSNEPKIEHRTLSLSRQRAWLENARCTKFE